MLASTAKEDRGMDPDEHVPLGKTALMVRRLGLGTAPLGGLFAAVDEAQAVAVAERAYEHGMRLFDTAPLYGYGHAPVPGSRDAPNT